MGVDGDAAHDGASVSGPDDIVFGLVDSNDGNARFRGIAPTPVRTTARTVVFGSLRRGSRHGFRVAAMTANSTSDRSIAVVAVVR